MSSEMVRMWIIVGVTLRAKPCGPTANTQRGGKSIVLISSTDSMYPWQVSGGKDNL